MSGVQKDYFFLKEGEKGIILLMLLVSKFCYIVYVHMQVHKLLYTPSSVAAK